MSIQDSVKFEKEYLQYVTYINPDMADYYYIVVDFKTYKDDTRPYLILRQLQTGKEIKTRIKQSKIYKSAPFGEFSILRIDGFAEDFKGKYINDKFIKTDERELILEEYEVIRQ